MCERVHCAPKCKYYSKRTMLKSREWEGPLCAKCKYYHKRTILKSRVWEGPMYPSASITLRGRCLNHVCERVHCVPKCKYYPKRTMLKRMISTVRARVPNTILRECLRGWYPLSRIQVLSNHDVWEDDIHCAPSASIILRGRCLNHVCERVPLCTQVQVLSKEDDA